ncbi:cation:dicarboxylase symporter family transporter [Tissierella sp. MB52-C2]|uniref:L-cystine transporter n=1 Tax=Tissierella sp. MB52-C2 TaxID=3070999 RepID=UPI00280BE34B|nr:cation:dicarboxylase symporter family transporter [Tissierella sp. MB52-C2]WMM23536.1 cation:dicarboxylase symporter family transporter [Tissierella sp. MB52-C2]
MNTNFAVIINIIVMLAIIYGLVVMKKKRFSFTVRVLLAMGLGIIYGIVLQLIFGSSSDIVNQSNTWFSIIGTGYVRLLRMIVIPLIFVSITSAIINQDSKNLGKMATQIIAVLLITTAISAFVGAGTANIFKLSAEGLQSGENEQKAVANLETRLEDFKSKPIQEQIVEIIPTNPFYSMTGQGSSATLSVVVFAAFIGLATIGIRKKQPDSAENFTKLIISLHDVVMRMVTMILKLTPYGVLGLMTKIVSTSNFTEILRLINFVIASYVALLIVFIIHLVILAIFGINPIIYLKKAATPLMFAFTSRSSAGTLPINIETQVEKLGVSQGHANLSASLGTSIGQNGCAGVYPAMLAVMIAPTVGINPLAPAFLIKLVIVTSLSSFGIAGVGGGATFAALTVLSTMGLPVGLVGLLIAIEPLIDMARTMVNVSDSIVAGLISSKLMGELNVEVYNSEVNAEG